MKKIAFNLSKDFHLHSITNNKIYELENDSTELVFSTVVEEAMVYELHVQTSDDKFYKTLYKKQNYVGIMLSNSILAKAGKMSIQVKGIKEANEGEEVIISNAYELTVGSFINAKFQPTPAEEDEFEKLVVKVEAIDSRVTHIISELGEVASDLETEKAERLETEVVFDRELKQEIEDRINAVNNLNTKVDENVAALGNAISEQGSIFSQAISSTAQSLNAEIEKKANAKDVYDKTAITALLSAKADLGTVNALDTTLRAEIAKKQDKLKAGANIHIDPVTNEISATGGGEGDVTKEYLKQNYYDKLFINDWDTLVVNEDQKEEICHVEERDISYSAIPLYCGKWVDGSDIHRRVYVVTSGIDKGNTIKIADKPANMKFLVRGFGIVEGTEASTKHTMTNSEITVYVNNDGVYAVQTFTGYAERLYIVLEYTVEGEPI